MKDIDTGRAVLGCQGVASAEVCLDPSLRRGDVGELTNAYHHIGVMAKPCSAWTGEAMLRTDGRDPDRYQLGSRLISADQVSR